MSNKIQMSPCVVNEVARKRELLDPRIRRTRASLREAIENLMQTHGFEKLSIQTIAERAGVSRATFYDHYPDKGALLDDLVSERFDELMARRGVAFDGSCEGALGATALAVCDYLAGARRTERTPDEPQSHLEAAIVAVVRRSLLRGMRREAPCDRSPTAELIAATASWAIYGAALEWLRGGKRPLSCEAARMIAELVEPVLTRAPWLHAHATP